MALYIIDKGTRMFSSNIMEDIEYVNPRDFLKNFHACSIIPCLLKVSKANLHMSRELIKEQVLKEAEDVAENHISFLEHFVLPPEIDILLDSTLSKKEQSRLLSDLTITKTQLGAIYIKAGAKGFLFSNYSFDGIPKAYKECDLPSFIRIKDDGDVESYGNHQLSKGQLKDIVLHSKSIIARILDKEDHWHCFYQTKKGVYGKEHGERMGSYPHIHYISNAYGISREDFVKGLKGGCVPSSPIHILLKEENR